MDPGQVHAHSASQQASAKRSTWRSVRVRSKAAVELGRVEGHLGVGLEDRAQGTAFLPGQPGVALDDPVGLVTRQPAGDQRQEHRLGEDQAQRALGQVLQRPLGVHDQAGGQAGGLAQHVAGQQGGIGQRHPFDRAVGDVPLVPQRHVLQTGAEVAALQARQPAQPLREDRVALVGHGRAALLAGAERLLRLAQLAAGQVADLGAHELNGRSDGRAGVEVLGMAVPGDHLGGRHRRQAQGGADTGLDRGVDVRERADRTGELAHGDPVAGRPQAATVTVGLQRPQRELGPERGGLGVHAVRPTRDRHVHQLQRAGLEGGHEGVEVGQQEVGGPGEGGAQRGVHHVRGRQPVVDVRTGRRADALLDDVDEGGHVVVGDLLALEHVGDEDVVDRRCLGPAGGGVLRRARRRRRPAPRWPATRPRATGRSGRCR